MRGIALRGRSLGMPESWIPIAEAVLEPHRASFRAALDAGVRCGIGTDGFGEMVDEMELFVEAGRTPYQAIQAATRDGARIMGLERRLGTFAPGFQPTSSPWPATPWTTSRPSAGPGS